MPNIVPADHSTTAKAIGLGGVAKMVLKAGFNYTRTMAYLAKKGKFKDLENFLYTKIFVPTGEGSGELAYYFIGDYLQKHPNKVPYPKYIEVEITTKCGFRCRICERQFWKEKNVELTLDQFKSLVDQFDLKWCNLTGEGDAFTNPDYLKMVSYVKSKGTSVFLVDSFASINEKTIYELVRMGVDGIYISIDGATKGTYESIKVGCNFDRVVRNLKALLAFKKGLKTPIPEICFRYIVNKTNVSEMGEYVRMLNRLGSRKEWGDGSKIHFAGLLDYPAIHDLYLPTIEQKYIDEAVNATKEFKDPLPVVFAHTQENTNPAVERCLAWAEPYFMLVPEPTMIACCAVLMSNNRPHLLKYGFGNYLKQPIKDIWNSPYYRNFRATVNDPSKPLPAVCVGCRAYATEERIKRSGIDHRVKEDFT